MDILLFSAVHGAGTSTNEASGDLEENLQERLLLKSKF